MGYNGQPVGVSCSWWQGVGNLNNGANDGFATSNGRNDLSYANANIGSRKC